MFKGWAGKDYVQRLPGKRLCSKAVTQITMLSSKAGEQGSMLKGWGAFLYVRQTEGESKDLFSICAKHV